MGKISNEARQQYFERIKTYKHGAESILQREKSILKIIKLDESGASYKYLTLANERLNIASHLLLQNELSVSLLGVKNEAFLNDARKSCYQSVIYLEEVVTNYVDAPFTDYTEKLEAIQGFDDQKRYELIRKLGFTIESVEEAFGSNSKWKWSFVELEGRYATVAKNLIDFKTLIAGLDPRIDGYSERLAHLELVKSLFMQSANRYREKYELSTLRIDDFKRSIDFLFALRRVHVVLGEIDKAEEIKKQIEVWKAKMEADEKRSHGKSGK